MPDVLTDPIVGSEEEPSTTPVKGKEVVVNLDEPKEPKGSAQAKEPAPAKEPTDDPKVAWLERQASAQRRIVERLERTIQDLTTRLSAPAPKTPPSGKEALPTGTPQTTVDRYDQLVEGGHWQEAVGLIAEERAKRILDARDQEAAAKDAEAKQAQALQDHMTLLAASKARVATRYTTLDMEEGDNTSPEAKLYAEAFKELEQENPKALTYPTAPELVMYRMEDLARQRGLTLKPHLPIAPGAGGNGRPAPRGGTPPPRGGAGPRTTTLSAEERQFCDYHGIKYEDYAKNRVALTSQEQVTT